MKDYIKSLEKEFSEITNGFKEIEKKAYSSRQEDLTTSEELSDYSYYSGKKW